MRDDLPLWKEIDRAVCHVSYARFGGYGPEARANLYRRAAELFMGVADLLLEMADHDTGYARAEAMVRRACASE